EKVYANSMAIEFRRSGIRYQQQAPITVNYENEIVGEHSADLLVEDIIIVELKATKNLAEEHEAQLLNYLKATTFEVGLLLNFGPKPEIKRKAFDNERKGNLTWVKP
ncbi:MAG TPA: GxxExxY protein, partial [bacterium]